MKKLFGALSVVALILGGVALADDEKKMTKEEKTAVEAQEKRDALDAMAKETMDTLFAEKEGSKERYDKAVAYAVFDNLKLAFIFSGGGGAGVAVEKSSGNRTYMKMGTVGVGIGIGAQKYTVVFLFENEKVFNDFVEKGWKAESSAQAASGSKGVNVGSNFSGGIAFYQFTKSGVMASADISGTKYWKDEGLNG